jgi:hypothetical protein
MRFALRNAVLFFLVAMVLCGSSFFVSCDTVLFREYEGPRGEQGEEGGQGEKGDKGPPGGTVTTDPEEEPDNTDGLTYYFFPIERGSITRS